MSVLDRHWGFFIFDLGGTQMSRPILFIIVVGVAILATAWFFRYSATRLNDQAYVKFDRWTQTSYVCDADRCIVAGPLAVSGARGW
jgi:hypothetical protein